MFKSVNNIILIQHNKNIIINRINAYKKRKERKKKWDESSNTEFM